MLKVAGTVSTLHQSAALPGRKGEETGAHGLYTQVAHDLECDAEEWNPLAGYGRTARLIFKTVAFLWPPYFLSDLLVTGSRDLIPMVFVVRSQAHSSSPHAPR